MTMLEIEILGYANAELVSKLCHLSNKGAGREAREKGRNRREKIERVSKQH